MSPNAKAMRSGSSVPKAGDRELRCSKGVGCLVTPLYRKQRSALHPLSSRGSVSIRCCSEGLPRRPEHRQQVRHLSDSYGKNWMSPHRLKYFLLQQVKRQDFADGVHGSGHQEPQKNVLHSFWLQILKVRAESSFRLQ